MDRVLAIDELWANIICFLYPRHIRRLRLVSKLVRAACAPYFNITLKDTPTSITPATLYHYFAATTATTTTMTITTSTPPAVFADPSEYITALYVDLDGRDQIPAHLAQILERCIHISTMQISNFGLDCSILKDILLDHSPPPPPTSPMMLPLSLSSQPLQQEPLQPFQEQELHSARLKRLILQSDGFVALASLVDILLASPKNHVLLRHLRELVLNVDDTGMVDTHTLSWPQFCAILDTFATSLTTLSLRGITINVEETKPEEIDGSHSLMTNHTMATTLFPNITSLSLAGCDVSSIGRLRFLKMFPNLKSLEIVCRDEIFDLEHHLPPASTSTATLPEQPATTGVSQPHHEADTQSFFQNLTHITIRLTNNRVHSHQKAFFQFLHTLPSLKSLNLHGISDPILYQDLIPLAEAWSHLGVRLKSLCLEMHSEYQSIQHPHHHSRPLIEIVCEFVLARILRQPSCSVLESLDAPVGPDLIFQFWNKTVNRSELPCLQTIRALHLRQKDAIRGEEHQSLQILNRTLKQMPRLVDLTIATGLDDFDVFQGLGRDPQTCVNRNGNGNRNGNESLIENTSLSFSKSKSASSESTLDPDATSTGERRDAWTSDWSQERPFLHTLAVGVTNEFFHKLRNERPLQVTRQFRFLVDFKLLQ
ncbi:hypothetical protein BGZ51_006433 [Haplosporangium sp. Z 767]|nr:hypothetical protein BGZ51_006433 [Haplosporangium sp. Z 767]